MDQKQTILVTFLDQILKSFKQLNSYHKETEQIKQNSIKENIQYVDKMIIVQSTQILIQQLQSDVQSINEFYGSQTPSGSWHRQKNCQATIKRFVWRITEILDLGEQGEQTNRMKKNISFFLNMEKLDGLAVLESITSEVVQMHSTMIADLESTQYKLYKVNSFSTIHSDIQAEETNLYDVPQQYESKFKKLLKQKFKSIFKNNRLLNYYQNKHNDLYYMLDIDTEWTQDFVLNNFVKKQKANALYEDLMRRNEFMGQTYKREKHVDTLQSLDIMIPKIVNLETPTKTSFLPQINNTQSPPKKTKQLSTIRSYNQSHLNVSIKEKITDKQYNQNLRNQSLNINTKTDLFDFQENSLFPQSSRFPMALIIDQSITLPSIHKLHDIYNMNYLQECRPSKITLQQFSKRVQRRNIHS